MLSEDSARRWPCASREAVSHQKPSFGDKVLCYSGLGSAKTGQGQRAKRIGQMEAGGWKPVAESTPSGRRTRSPFFPCGRGRRDSGEMPCEGQNRKPKGYSWAVEKRSATAPPGRRLWCRDERPRSKGGAGRAPGGLSRSSARLPLRSWTPGSRVRAPCRALCCPLGAWSLLWILSPSLSLCPSLAHFLSLSQKNKICY